ncbi:hypothetical protein ABW20_dc0100659 [Dactylellina cionopaga]|nr:hypothetical protein ABW20_dc0100659 [Dactylellina cionopaga]
MILPEAQFVLSLYRTVLRELPPIVTRVPATSTPNTHRLPVHKYLRGYFYHGVDGTASGARERKRLQTWPDHVTILRIRQTIRYLAAQRSYVGLLERYNAGLSDDKQDRIRLAARRVGLDIAELGKTLA